MTIRWLHIFAHTAMIKLSPHLQNCYDIYSIFDAKRNFIRLSLWWKIPSKMTPWKWENVSWRVWLTPFRRHFTVSQWKSTVFQMETETIYVPQGNVKPTGCIKIKFKFPILPTEVQHCYMGFSFWIHLSDGQTGEHSLSSCPPDHIENLMDN